MPSIELSSLTPIPAELSLEKSVLILNSRPKADAKLASQVVVN